MLTSENVARLEEFIADHKSLIEKYSRDALSAISLLRSLGFNIPDKRGAHRYFCTESEVAEFRAWKAAKGMAEEDAEAAP